MSFASVDSSKLPVYFFPLPSLLFVIHSYPFELSLSDNILSKPNASNQRPDGVPSTQIILFTSNATFTADPIHVLLSLLSNITCLITLRMQCVVLGIIFLDFPFMFFSSSAVHFRLPAPYLMPNTSYSFYAVLTSTPISATFCIRL